MSHAPPTTYEPRYYEARIAELEAALTIAHRKLDSTQDQTAIYGDKLRELFAKLEGKALDEDDLKETVAAWERRLGDAILAEREACAQLAWSMGSGTSDTAALADRIAAAIRARGKTSAIEEE